MRALNDTHDPALRSWVDSADRAGTDFPIQNLPLAVFRRRGERHAFGGGVAIGDQVLDLARALEAGVLRGSDAEVARLAAGPALDPLMALGPDASSALRAALSRLLRRGADARDALASCLVPQADAEYAVPARIGDYTDFYTGIHHATAVGKLFRPDNPLLPNYKWVPIGYHGRVSSIDVGERPLTRPRGQLKPADGAPVLEASRRLDYELELGYFIGQGNARGEPIPIDRAQAHLFGVTLLNDWSARDIQAWEYQPLGPFLAKNFATTLSPWIVTMEALAPFRAPCERPAGDPPPLPYLDSPDDRSRGAFDITMEAWLQTRAMRAAGRPPVLLGASNAARAAYWTAAQLVAHHTVNGCNLRPGDLLGSGTLSGEGAREAGSLLELTQGGRLPLSLPGGETRTFLEDGDTLALRGHCARDGAARIGLGEAVATIAAAPDRP